MTRIKGRLAKWNDDRGFGFIEPTHGGDHVFVHISALPRDGRRPMNGETLLFEVQTDAQGRKRAVSVERPGRVVSPAHEARRPSSSRSPERQGTGLFGYLLLFAGVGFGGYLLYGQIDAHLVQRINGTAPVKSGASANFRCDGRQHCSQMTSCDEATFFIENCPDTKMDGDNDGVPCEQQCSAF
ncbi:cold shock domain-containing protein [Methyloversatilis sp.]|uniref:cold shock domain-containing protein n=1 Tax=Methyloversatilis sp. TaxID=2569862 RepID=UPI00273284CD|nr:cold shock domain-containing protein [Methyloversatilis sp.]MDP2870484.1 cold shock domain-containing protein [Methyloversatilis sp.]MDP3457447.1 cold shock domain-containing protein [Methyloversatilis sp.]MDP3576520.1 cold shock domain-containing protein [Methyloversatilis sp.]